MYLSFRSLLNTSLIVQCMYDNVCMSKPKARKTNTSKRYNLQPCREKVSKEMDVVIKLSRSEVSLSFLQHAIAFGSRLRYACADYSSSE